MANDDNHKSLHLKGVDFHYILTYPTEHSPYEIQEIRKTDKDLLIKGKKNKKFGCITPKQKEYIFKLFHKSAVKRRILDKSLKFTGIFQVIRDDKDEDITPKGEFIEEIFSAYFAENKKKDGKDYLKALNEFTNTLAKIEQNFETHAYVVYFPWYVSTIRFHLIPRDKENLISSRNLIQHTLSVIKYTKYMGVVLRKMINNATDDTDDIESINLCTITPVDFMYDSGGSNLTREEIFNDPDYLKQVIGIARWSDRWPEYRDMWAEDYCKNNDKSITDKEIILIEHENSFIYNQPKNDETESEKNDRKRYIMSLLIMLECLKSAEAFCNYSVTEATSELNDFSGKIDKINVYEKKLKQLWDMLKSILPWTKSEIEEIDEIINDYRKKDSEFYSKFTISAGFISSITHIPHIEHFYLVTLSAVEKFRIEKEIDEVISMVHELQSFGNRILSFQLQIYMTALTVWITLLTFIILFICILTLLK